MYTESGRAILDFIREHWGSIDGYLNFIGFSVDSQKALRDRFIVPSIKERLIYKTPPNTPFWVGNPAVLIPKRPDKREGVAQQLKRTPSMERILRAVSLLELRDSFEAEQSGPNGGWTIARRKLFNLARTRREATEIQAVVLGKDTSKPEAISSTRTSQVDDSADRQSYLLSQALKCREALEEILLAKKIVLAKLQSSLRMLTGVDVVRLLMYRNVQLYADKNRAIKGSTAPELSEVVLK